MAKKDKWADGMIEDVEEPIIADPIIADPKPEPRPNRRPQPAEIRISVRQYIRARGYRSDRAAGFMHEMKRHPPADKTRPEWDALWNIFWARPVA